MSTSIQDLADVAQLRMLRRIVGEAKHAEIDARIRDLERERRQVERAAEATVAEPGTLVQIRFDRLPTSKNALKIPVMVNGKPRIVYSGEGRKWMRYAAAEAKRQWSMPPLGGPVELAMHATLDQRRLLPRAEKGTQGLIKGQGIDLDIQNLPEVLCDVLEGIIYVNDRQVSDVVLRKRYVVMDEPAEFAVVTVTPVDPDLVGWVAK